MPAPLRVGDSPVHLLELGKGPPLLLLHGNPDSSEMWRDLASRLADEHRCLAPDLPGFGRSARLPDDHPLVPRSLEQMSAWVEALLAALSLSGPIDLAVHDVGAFFGLSWAVEHPERVRRLVITNAFYAREYRWHFWARVWRTRRLGELSAKLFLWPIFLAEMRRGSRHLSADHLRRTFELVTPAMKQEVLALYRAMDPERFAGWDDRLRALTARVPTLVAWGDADPYIPRDFADRFGAQAVHHLPVGHWVAAEAPRELAGLMRPFLRAPG